MLYEMNPTFEMVFRCEAERCYVIGSILKCYREVLNHEELPEEMRDYVQRRCKDLADIHAAATFMTACEAAVDEGSPVAQGTS